MGYITKHTNKNEMSILDFIKEEDAIMSALQEFSNELSKFLNPIGSWDMPIICVGLLTAYRTLKENMPPDLKCIEEIIEKEINACGIIAQYGGKKE